MLPSCDAIWRVYSSEIDPAPVLASGEVHVASLVVELCTGSADGEVNAECRGGQRSRRKSGGKGKEGSKT